MLTLILKCTQLLLIAAEQLDVNVIPAALNVILAHGELLWTQSSVNIANMPDSVAYLHTPVK